MNKYAQFYFNTYFAKLAKIAPPPPPPPSPIFKPGPNHINRPTEASDSVAFPPRAIGIEPLAILPELPEERPVLPLDPTQTGLNEKELAEQRRRFNNPPIQSTFLANLSPPSEASVSSSSSSSSKTPLRVKEETSVPSSGQIAKPLSNQITVGSAEALRPKTKADLIKNWSTYHGKRNSFNSNSSADKAMLDAMVDAKINGESVVAVANGKLSTEGRQASGNLISYKNDPNSIYSRTLKQ